MTQRRAALIAVFGAAVAHALVFDFVNDDAFISFRYADNWVRHGELVFNLGERVEGYTNFLWTVLMAGVIAVGLDPVPWSRWLGIAFALGTLAVVARFSAKIEGRASTWDALAPSMLAASPAFACWSTGGLETSMFTCLTTIGVTQYLLERQEGHRGLPTSGLWLAASAMTRPEGMLVFAVAGLHRLCEMLLRERAVRPTLRDWQWGLGFAALFLPYFAWRWSYYGYPFPNTYYVKADAPGFWALGLRYWGSWLAQNALLWGVPILALAPRDLPGGDWNRIRSFVALLTFVVSLHVIRVGGDFMALHRFLVPVMPGIAVVCASGLRGWVSRIRRAGVPRLGIAVATALAVVGVGAHVRAVDENALRWGNEQGIDSIGWLAWFAEQGTAIGKHLALHAAPDARIATTAAGAIPYYSRLYTLDQKGLNDEYIAHEVPPDPRRLPRPGHTKTAPLDYLLEKDIDYVIYHPTLGKTPPPRRPGELASWKKIGYRWETVRVEGLSVPWWGYWRLERSGPGR